MENNYGYTKEYKGTFEEAEKKLKEELTKEGFGVLTEIDVKKTLKKKLNVEFEEYKILGACNPPFAYEALKNEIEIGLLLPCNIIIYKKENKILVSAIVPSVAMGMVQNEKLGLIATEVEEKIKKIINETIKY